MPAEDIRHPEKQPNSSKGDCEPYGNSPSGEAAQTPAHAISKREVNKKYEKNKCVAMNQIQ